MAWTPSWRRKADRAGETEMIDIGMRLKSDEVIDFVELYDLSVEYHFDRLHEGESDFYTVESEDLSLDLRFDADQRCNAIFVRDPGAALAKGSCHSRCSPGSLVDTYHLAVC